jgi:hypothetical protein
MALSAEDWIEMIEDANRAYEDAQAELRRAKERVFELSEKSEVFQQERNFFIASFERRFPDHASPDAISEQHNPQIDLFPHPWADDWSNETRSDAVEHAVREITEKNEYATPAQIEEFLSSKNREDTRDAIGATLAYLNKTSKVHSTGRAQWAIGPASD